MTGYSNSSNYPTTTGVYQESYNGSEDIVISKLDAGLTDLLSSTFLGGSDSERSTSIVLDDTGNVYVAGVSTSSDYSTTVGAFDESYNNYNDIIITKLDSDLSSLLASTYLGGSYEDEVNSFVLNSSGNLYVIGDTQSNDFPATVGAYDNSFNDL